ncbi:MAG: immunoglobulin domain-containing protein [Melioribacteraceae bacterium]|nr:immunoglobulin domain-containing protein [Melioribacteraceae bacterium]MCF8354605.1 immunoglobulin domain-containing protein [Melioribacteraceae bacterium]MCF8396362.1 immunoglobulin domain-containing protein [Melioribacteraceae bacterium]MCF8420182.1 immunoglobulin domain-containing protein [Melioribacteraceae bacterium]
MHSEIEIPFRYNAIKHHLIYIVDVIATVRRGEKELGDLNSELIHTGDSVLDLYVGKQPVSKIINQIKISIPSSVLKNREEFISWLNCGKKDYKTIIINDNSSWILRLSDDLNYFIHLHPGRYSVNTIRTKSITLKTAVLYCATEKFCDAKKTNIDRINYIRQTCLNESPIKKVNRKNGIGKLISIICDEIKE